MRASIVSVLTAAAVLSLAACSSGGGTQSGSSAADETEVGPLEKYLSAMWSGQEMTQEDYDKQNAEREELIAQCMTKEGFEYTPAASGGTVVFSSDDSDGPAWGSKEFAETYGYGIIDWPGREVMEESHETAVDPNESYVNSLSESEQNAFYEALSGKPLELTEEEAESYEYNWEDNGCYGWAEHELSGDETSAEAWEDPEFTDLFESLNSFYETYGVAEGMNEVEAEWVKCMDEAGFPGFAKREDAQMSMFNKQNEMYSAATGADGEWVEPSTEVTEAFRAEEIKLASADWTCADKVGYEEKQKKVQFEAEQKFLDEHKAELDALLAKYSQNSQSK